MTTKASVLQSIRRKCLDCSCYQPSEVQLCPVTTCALWPFRFGRDPQPSRNRGFAKPPGHTEQITSDPAGGYPTSPPLSPSLDSSVYTERFETDGVTP
jgi:hypothetical protein